MNIRQGCELHVCHHAAGGITVHEVVYVYSKPPLPPPALNYVEGSFSLHQPGTPLLRHHFSTQDAAVTAGRRLNVHLGRVAPDRSCE